ncbi:hypothetical protein PY793_13335 [Acetobacter fabarum]|uniref:hypothetical protein n=1 Tax=Acetobacter fabarum TaxID=483199 RepID=UPI00312B4805
MAYILLRSSLDDLVLLEFRGQPVILNYETVARVTGSSDRLRFGFAEPIVCWPRENNPGEISWYAEGKGQFRQLALFPAEEREALLRDLVAEITRLRQSVLVAGTSDIHFLDFALIIPGSEAIFTDGDRFVLAPWGAMAGREKGLKISDRAVDFGKSFLGRLSEQETPPVMDRHEDEKIEKSDPFAATEPPASGRVPKQDMSLLAGEEVPFPEVSVAAVSYDGQLPMSGASSILLHIFVFISFFLLTLWAALTIIGHSHGFGADFPVIGKYFGVGLPA